MREKGTKTRFECTCNGCRNYPTRPAEVWHEAQIPSKTQGYFFSPSTMKMFKSRISDFKPVGISPSGIDSLAVIVSSLYGIDGAERYYEIVVICPYGNLWRERNTDETPATPFIKYETLRKARASKTWHFNIPAPVCDCHGCQLDREAVSNA